MSAAKVWLLISVIVGIAVASGVLVESLPRNMLGGKNLGSSYVALCLISLTFTFIHWQLSSKHWLAELSSFIVASPIVITLAYLVGDYARFTDTLKGLPNLGSFLFSPFTTIAAAYGGIAGMVTILLQRFTRRLQSPAPEN